MALTNNSDLLKRVVDSMKFNLWDNFDYQKDLEDENPKVSKPDISFSRMTSILENNHRIKNKHQDFLDDLSRQHTPYTTINADVVPTVIPEESIEENEVTNYILWYGTDFFIFIINSNNDDVIILRSVSGIMCKPLLESKKYARELYQKMIDSGEYTEFMNPEFKPKERERPIHESI